MPEGGRRRVLENEAQVSLSAEQDAEVLVFDLANSSLIFLS